MSLNLYTYSYNSPLVYWDPSGHVALRKGSTGKEVEDIQRELDIEVTGVFDDQTLAAVNAFKTDKKLGNTGEWYGVVGNQTYASIMRGEAVTQKEMIEKGFKAGSDDSVYYDGGGISAKEVEDRVVKKPKKYKTEKQDSSTDYSKESNDVTEEKTLVEYNWHNSMLDDEDGYKPIVIEDEPEMKWDERVDHVVDGTFRLSIGGIAVVAGVTVLTGGTGTIPIIIGIGTIAAGTTTAVIGTAEVGEGITGGYNYVRDDIMGGNEELYYMTDAVSVIGATGGTLYCAYANDIDVYMKGMKNNKGTSKAISNADNLLDSALTLHGKKNTAVGRAFQKHSVREGTAFVGEITGNPAKNTEQGLKYLNNILGSPSSTQTVRNTKAFGEVLEVRLPDGMGARWSSDGSKFIGFLERYIK